MIEFFGRESSGQQTEAQIIKTIKNFFGPAHRTAPAFWTMIAHLLDQQQGVYGPDIASGDGAGHGSVAGEVAGETGTHGFARLPSPPPLP